MNPQPKNESGHVTDEPYDPRNRFGLYRLCECTTCEGKGKALPPHRPFAQWRAKSPIERCSECRGEGRVRQELATCETPEAVGVALVTLAREGEFEECPLGLLDREPECGECGGDGKDHTDANIITCPECKGTGKKKTGTWLLLPWAASARNVTDAARTLAKSRKKVASSD